MEKLYLFTVTLFWGEPDSDEGDYSTWVWAKDEAQAIQLVAEDMAENNDAEISVAERPSYIESIIANASPYAAERVGQSSPNDLQRLLKGPTEEWSPEAKADFEAIMAILAKYTA